MAINQNYTPGNWNPSYSGDTTNLGVTTGMQTNNPWDSKWGPAGTPPSSSSGPGGGSPFYTPGLGSASSQFGAAGLSTTPGLNTGGGNAGVNGGGAGSISGLIANQLSNNAQARQDNLNWLNKQSGENAAATERGQSNWTNSGDYLKNFANPGLDPSAYNAYKTPLSPEVIQQMKNVNNMQSQAGANNAYTQTQGALAAGGQTDASSLAAAASQANRNALGAQIGANTNLGIQAATINNNAGMAATGAQQQAQLANNKAGFDVGNSIISHMPQQHYNDTSAQFRPDNNSSLMAMSLANQAANNLGGGGAAGSGGITASNMNGSRPIAGVAQKPLGGQSAYYQNGNLVPQGNNLNGTDNYQWSSDANLGQIQDQGNSNIQMPSRQTIQMSSR